MVFVWGGAKIPFRFANEISFRDVPVVLSGAFSRSSSKTPTLPNSVKNLTQVACFFHLRKKKKWMKINV